MSRRKEPYCLYKRRNIKGQTIWYFRAWDGEKRLAGHSTGCSTKASEARAYCDELKATGRLADPGAPLPGSPESKKPTLREWAESESWWQWGKCRYIRGQLARSDENKPAVSKRYCDDALRDLKAWILPCHGKKRLDEIIPKDCESLLFTWQEKGLGKKSINNCSSIYRIMLGEAERLGVIARTPWDRVKSFKPSDHRKGILTVEEARRLLNPSTVDSVWSGNRMYHSANLLAAMTGLRLGEVLALTRENLFPDHVHVAGSWAIGYGLGPTKTKRVDDLPIPRFVYDTIDSWCIWNGFIFSFSAREEARHRQPSAGGPVPRAGGGGRDC